jgi:alpha-L-arabinofuranosidase
VLTSPNAEDENSLEEPTKVSPKAETVSIPGPKFSRELPGNSLTVLRIPAKN